jgi:hypothetical protein
MLCHVTWKIRQIAAELLALVPLIQEGPGSNLRARELICIQEVSHCNSAAEVANTFRGLVQLLQANIGEVL